LHQSCLHPNSRTELSLHPEEPQSGVSKDEGAICAKSFVVRDGPSGLLTMKDCERWLQLFVIPAQAGIQPRLAPNLPLKSWIPGPSPRMTVERFCENITRYRKSPFTPAAFNIVSKYRFLSSRLSKLKISDASRFAITNAGSAVFSTTKLAE
jgi:hypothetical protein